MAPVRFAEPLAFAGKFCPAAAQSLGGSARTHHAISNLYRWGISAPERAPKRALYAAVALEPPVTLSARGADSSTKVVGTDDLQLLMGAVCESSKVGVLYVGSLLPPETSPEAFTVASEKMAEAVLASSGLHVAGGAGSAFLLASQSTLGPDTLASLTALAVASNDGGAIGATVSAASAGADAGAHHGGHGSLAHLFDSIGKPPVQASADASGAAGDAGAKHAAAEAAPHHPAASPSSAAEPPTPVARGGPASGVHSALAALDAEEGLASPGGVLPSPSSGFGAPTTTAAGHDSHHDEHDVHGTAHTARAELEAVQAGLHGAVVDTVGDDAHGPLPAALAATASSPSEPTAEAEAIRRQLDATLIRAKPWSRAAANQTFTFSQGPSMCISTAPPPPSIAASATTTGAAPAGAAASTAADTPELALWKPFPVRQVVGEPAVASAVAAALARQLSAGPVGGGCRYVTVPGPCLAVYEFSHPSLYEAGSESFLQATGGTAAGAPAASPVAAGSGSGGDGGAGSGASAVPHLRIAAHHDDAASAAPSSSPYTGEALAARDALKAAAVMVHRAHAVGLRLRAATIDDYGVLANAFYQLDAVAAGKAEPPAAELAALTRSLAAAAAKAGAPAPHLGADALKQQWLARRGAEIKASIAAGEYYLLSAPEPWLVEEGVIPAKAATAAAHRPRRHSASASPAPGGSPMHGGMASPAPAAAMAGLSLDGAAAGANAPAPADAESALAARLHLHITRARGNSTAASAATAAAASSSGGSQDASAHADAPALSLVNAHGTPHGLAGGAAAQFDADVASTVPQIAVAMAAVRGRNPFGARVGEVNVLQSARRRGFAQLLLSLLAHRLVSEEGVPSVCLFAGEGDAGTARLMEKSGFVQRGTTAAVDVLAESGAGGGCMAAAAGSDGGDGHHHKACILQ